MHISNLIRHFRATLQPGNYLIGDPCHLVPEDQWDYFLNSLYHFHSTPVGQFISSQNKPAQLLCFDTGYGDGLYPSRNDEMAIPVDTGMIGIALESDFSASQIEKMEIGKLVFRYTSDQSFECSGKNGLMRFGEIEIDTR